MIMETENTRIAVLVVFVNKGIWRIVARFCAYCKFMPVEALIVY
jgi:hypothetical protein